MNSKTRLSKKDEIGFDSSDVEDATTTEEFEDACQKEEIEQYVREEVHCWLAIHGSKLFSLETSKFLAKTAAPYKNPQFQVGRPKK